MYIHYVNNGTKSFVLIWKYPTPNCWLSINRNLPSDSGMIYNEYWRKKPRKHLSVFLRTLNIKMMAEGLHEI